MNEIGIGLKFLKFLKAKQKQSATKKAGKSKQALSPRRYELQMPLSVCGSHR